MVKNFSIILFALLLTVKGFGQSGNKLNIESGASINQALNKSDHFKDNGHSTTRFDWTYKHQTTTGYFFKLGFEGKTCSHGKNNKWSISIPMSLSYLNQKTKFYRYGYTWGCFGGTAADELVTISNQIVNLSVGPAVQYQSGKWRIGLSLLSNNCVTVKSSTKRSSSEVVEISPTLGNLSDFNVYASSQLTILFHLKEKIWIGPACEIFYYNIPAFMVELKQKQNGGTSHFENSPQFNLTGKNIWINPGVRLQIDLR